jgi:hypothetical protein
MAKIKPSSKAKLFVGVMYSDETLYKKIIPILTKKFGAIETESKIYDFTRFTDYYCAEMGKSLKKRFVVFEKKIDRSRLAGIKVWTNSIEARFAKKGKRQVNLDPGYFTLHNLVLASMKDRGQRICLGKGAYAELTLMFLKGNRCIHFNWTYPDFKSDGVKKFFLEERSKLIYR